jgi:nucleotide-binding universal stress UspA family protein
LIGRRRDGRYRGRFLGTPDLASYRSRNNMLPLIVIGAHPNGHEPEPIDLGLMLARLTHAPIDVVSSFWFDATPQRSAPDEYRQTLRDDIHQALEHAIGDPDRVFGELRIHMMCGSAPHAIYETASRLGAGVIVVGSTHRGAVGRIALGNTTDRVIDRATCPVAVAPRGFRDGLAAPERVGVAFVDTPGGRAALRAGAAIARHTQAGLIAYTVIESHTRTRDRARAEEAVERAIAEHAHDIRCEARVLRDGGIDALVEESRGLDFLVRGSRGHRPVPTPLALGLPSKLARRVACPFVVVPPGIHQPLVALFAAHAGAGRHKVVAS